MKGPLVFAFVVLSSWIAAGVIVWLMLTRLARRNED